MVAVGLDFVLVDARLGEDFLIELLLLGHQGFAFLHMADHGAVHHTHRHGVGTAHHHGIGAEEYHGVAQPHSVLPIGGTRRHGKQKSYNKRVSFHHSNN